MTREEAWNRIDAIIARHEIDDEYVTVTSFLDYDALRMARKALEQEPKTGHWIMTGDYLTTAYSSIDYVKCSCCNEYSLEEGDYCPNCGAKMEESEDIKNE